MVLGISTTIYYMLKYQPWLREIFLGIPKSEPVVGLWFDILPISAGVFGVPVGFAVIILVSLITPAPSRETQDLVEHVRYPNLKAA